MPKAPTFPSIPVPKDDIMSLLITTTALKRTVEMLTGQEPATPNTSTKPGEEKPEFFAPHVFVQADTPTAYHVGDFWLAQRKSWSFSIWTGTDWILLVDLPTPVPVVGTRGYASIPRFPRLRR